MSRDRKTTGDKMCEGNSSKCRNKQEKRLHQGKGKTRKEKRRVDLDQKERESEDRQ